MIQRAVQGSIEVICGSMFSGKTEELLRRLRRSQFARQKIQVFKPAIDQRYSEDHVQSHDSGRFPSVCVQTSSEILKQVEDRTRVVGVDEAQFLDAGIVGVVNRLANRGVKVLVAGLDLDFRGNPFGPMPELMAVAEQVTKLSAVCMVCGAPASRTQRLLKAPLESGLSEPSDEGEHSQTAEELSQKQILVGAQEFYEARCRICHEPDAISTFESQQFSFSLTPEYSADSTQLDLSP